MPKLSPLPSKVRDLWRSRAVHQSSNAERRNTWICDPRGTNYSFVRFFFGDRWTEVVDIYMGNRFGDNLGLDAGWHEGGFSTCTKIEGKSLHEAMRDET